MIHIFASTTYLHIPDGFLSLVVSIICWLAAVAVLTIAVRRSQASLDDRLVPLAGIKAAFIFAGQMINFPVAGGTSGHLVGAALATIVLGPWLGILVMAAVLILQALMFQDGGLVAMGANIIVMGVVPALVGYGLYRASARRPFNQRLVVAGVAGWLSVISGAFVVALLLWLSGTVSLGVVLPAMLGWHMLIGLGEAVVTVGALAFIQNARPQLLDQAETSSGPGWIIGGVVISLLVVLLAPLASANPDGLEYVAAQSGFLGTAQDALFSVLPDYTVPALGDGALSTIVAGLIGALMLAAIVYLISRVLRKPVTAK